MEAILLLLSFTANTFYPLNSGLEAWLKCALYRMCIFLPDSVHLYQELAYWDEGWIRPVVRFCKQSSIGIKAHIACCPWCDSITLPQQGSCHRDCVAHKAQNIYCVVLCWRSMLTSALCLCKVWFPRTASSLGNLLEAEILKPYPKLLNQKLRGESLIIWILKIYFKIF